MAAIEITPSVLEIMLLSFTLLMTGKGYWLASQDKTRCLIDPTVNSGYFVLEICCKKETDITRKYEIFLYP